MNLEAKKYIKYQQYLFIANTIVLIFGILLHKLDFGSYSTAVENEIVSWNHGPIINIQTIDANQQCGDDQETIVGYALGTKPICQMKGRLDYQVGKCSKGQRSTSNTKNGMQVTPLQVFDGKKICITRQQNMTYHLISENQNNLELGNPCGASQKVCGPSNTQSGYSFCQSTQDQCPANAIIFQSTTSQVTPPSIDNYSPQSYNADWNMYISTNQPENPMVEIYVGLTKPCGDITQKYGPKVRPSKPVYTDGECNFMMNNSAFHTSYFDTGFSESEKSVLSENNVNLAPYVPNYQDSDLDGNFYHIYTKPYPNWSNICQDKYPTTLVVEHSIQIHKITKNVEAVYMVSLIQMFQFFIIWCILRQYSPTRANHKFIEIFSSLSMFFSCILYMLIWYFFTATFIGISQIEKKQLQFYVENNCSNDIVNYSFSKINETSHSMLVLSVIGMLFTTIMLIIDAIASLDSLNLLKCSKDKKDGVKDQLLNDKNNNNQF